LDILTNDDKLKGSPFFYLRFHLHKEMAVWFPCTGSIPVCHYENATKRYIMGALRLQDTLFGVSLK
jgi:hypothetical protein